MTSPIDVMVLAPHPDDAEMSCGGTIMRLVATGAQVVIVDMTRGEKGSRGTVETRAEECAGATAILGVQGRENLGLPDAELRDDDDALRAVIKTIRNLRPRLLLAPLDRDLHPDHQATGAVARRAFFTSGLANLHPELGTAFRPEMMMRYPLHDDVPPSLCVDISAVVERKRAALKCYQSQLSGDRSHLAGLDLLQRAHARDLFYGAKIGAAAAEPFSVDGPLAVKDLLSVLSKGPGGST